MSFNLQHVCYNLALFIFIYLFIFAIYLDFSGGKQNHSGDVEGSKIYISNITH